MVTTLFATLLLLTACIPLDKPGDSSKPPDKDWFGNPLPTQDPKCDLADPPEPDPKDFAPADTNNGNIKTHIVTMSVDTLGLKSSKFGGIAPLCLPVSIHIFGALAGQTAIKIDEGPGQQTLPWNGIRSTPWSATFIAQYDVTKVGSPVMQLDLSATYTPGPGWSDTKVNDEPGPIQLSCNLKIDGKSLNILTKNFGGTSKVNLSPTNPSFVRCEAVFSPEGV